MKIIDSIFNKRKLSYDEFIKSYVKAYKIVSETEELQEYKYLMEDFKYNIIEGYMRNDAKIRTNAVIIPILADMWVLADMWETEKCIPFAKSKFDSMRNGFAAGNVEPLNLIQIFYLLNDFRSYFPSKISDRYIETNSLDHRMIIRTAIKNSFLMVAKMHDLHYSVGLTQLTDKLLVSVPDAHSIYAVISHNQLLESVATHAKLDKEDIRKVNGLICFEQ